MSYPETVFLSLSIFIPGIISAVKIRTADKAFYPFFICLWLACGNEVISLVMANRHSNTAINNNIYVLLEILLIVWQFKNWNLFRHFKNAFWYIFIFTLIVWLMDYYSLNRIQFVKPGFRIICSFMIVLFSLNLTCRLIYTQQGHLEKSPVFIIGSGFILYFTFKIFIEAFLIYGVTASPAFYGGLFFILSVVNLITNLLYSIALLCIPRKIFYTDPY